MAFEIEYIHERVLVEIESWPVDVLADYGGQTRRRAARIHQKDSADAGS